MHSFKDTVGRLWEVVINVAQVRRVRGLVGGVDLHKLIDDQCRPLAELLADPCRLVDVLYALCKEQADKAGVTDEAFGASLGGDVLEEAAHAFLEELIDFFPKHIQETLRKLFAKSRQLAQTLLGHARTRVDELDVEEMASTLIASLTRRPASLASTPAPSP